MTEQIINAISIIKNEKKCVQSNCDRDCGKCELVKEEFEIVDAFDVAIKALEKQIPKKPQIEITSYSCECGKRIQKYDKFCFSCGQAIDWSDKNDR